MCQGKPTDMQRDREPCGGDWKSRSGHSRTDPWIAKALKSSLAVFPSLPFVMVRMSCDPRQSAIPVRRGQPLYLAANLARINGGPSISFLKSLTSEKQYSFLYFSWKNGLMAFFFPLKIQKITLFNVPKMYLLEEFRKTHKFEKEFGDLGSKNTRNRESLRCLISTN